MATNIEKARMQQKHDTASNWNNVENFVPKEGEFIVYDKDEHVNRQTFKIGDGESAIQELPTIGGEVYVQNKMPANASEGAVWIVPDEVANEVGNLYRGEIVGYNYNSAKLPKLPTLAREDVPYIYIIKGNDNIFQLWRYSVPLYALTTSTGYVNGYTVDSGLETQGSSVAYYYAILVSGVWDTANAIADEFQKGDVYGEFSSSYSIVWTNTDIYTRNGKLVFSATEPTPIYESEDDSFQIDWSLTDSYKKGYVHNKPLWLENREVVQELADKGERVTFTIKEKGKDAYQKEGIHISNLYALAPSRTGSGSEIDLNTLNIQTALGSNIHYSKIDYTEPEEYNSLRATYPYTLIIFEYENNASDWSKIFFKCSASPFYYDSDYKTEAYSYYYKKTSGEWSDKEGLSSNQGQGHTLENNKKHRFLANHNVFIKGTNNIKLMTEIPSKISEVEIGESIRLEIIFSQSQLASCKQELQSGESKIFLLSGAMVGYSSDSTFFTRVYKDSENMDVLGCLLVSTSDENARPTGTYFFLQDEGVPMIHQLGFSYSKVKVQEKYSSILKPIRAVNVYTMESLNDLNVSNSEEGEQLLQWLQEEISRFEPGSLVFIPQVSGGNVNAILD